MWRLWLYLIGKRCTDACSETHHYGFGCLYKPPTDA